MVVDITMYESTLVLSKTQKTFIVSDQIKLFYLITIKCRQVGKSDVPSRARVETQVLKACNLNMRQDSKGMPPGQVI